MDDVQRAREALEAVGGLVTPAEIAAEWGISDQALSQRIARGTFPTPVKVAGRTRLYLKKEADRFMVDEVIARRRAELERHAAAARRAIELADDEDVATIRAQLADYEAQLAKLGR